MQEETLYEWWQIFARTGQVIESGRHKLKVIQSGRLNTARGPDFTAARFELDGIVYQGDVECHVRHSDWINHGHHLDKAYRLVLLHITAETGQSAPVFNNWTDALIPTVQLKQPLLPQAQKSANLQTLPDDELRNLLQERALNRFENKIKHFISLLEHKNDEQVFHEYFLRVFGYPNNADTFQLLASNVLQSWLMKYRIQLLDDSKLFYAIFAGQAGFIPQTASDQFTESLMDLYKKWSSKLPASALSSGQWQFAGVRPRNHPHLRLAAWVFLNLCHRFELKDRIFDTLILRLDPGVTYKKLQLLLSCAPDDYWQSHYAIGKVLPGGYNYNLPGESRILELLINLILPYFVAQSVLTHSEGFRFYLTDLYLSLPLREPYTVFEKKQEIISRAKKVWPSQTMYQAFMNPVAV